MGWRARGSSGKRWPLSGAWKRGSLRESGRRRGGRQWAGARGRFTCRAGVGFEVLEGRSWAGWRGRRSPLPIRSDRQGGGRLCRRSNSRLGSWTLPSRQWGATGVSEQGRAALDVAPLFFPDRAELCSIAASPLDGDILANLTRPAFPGHNFQGEKQTWGPRKTAAC